METLISIIVPTHNRAALLLETLASVIAQTDGRFECVIVDDHSTDDSLARVAPLLAQDSRFRLIALPDTDRGAQAARNVGIAAARGTHVMLLDSDDLLAPHCVAQRRAAIVTHADKDFVVFPCECFRKVPGDVGKLWNVPTSENDLDRFLKLDVPWQTTSPLWRRDSLARIMPWPLDVPVGQDWEFHIRALALGLTYARAGTVDHYWRMADADRASIGKNTMKPDLLRSRVGVNERVVNVLRKANQLTPARRALLAGVFLQSAERVADRVSRTEGRAVWKHAHALRLISALQRLEGDAYLFSFRLPKVRAWLSTVLRRRWPRAYFVERSVTYLNAPSLPRMEQVGQTNLLEAQRYRSIEESEKKDTND